MALSEPVGQRVSDWVLDVRLLISNFVCCYSFVCLLLFCLIHICWYICVCIISIFFCICLLVFADGSSCSAPLTSLVGRNSPIRSARDPSNGSKNKKIRQGKNKKENKSLERNVFNSIRFLNFSSIPSILQIDQNISLQIPLGNVLHVSLWTIGQPIPRFLKVGSFKICNFPLLTPPTRTVDRILKSRIKSDLRSRIKSDLFDFFTGRKPLLLWSF